jgi:hypothetical protein
MNANELADLIDSEDTLWLEDRLSDISTMLRNQQAEIEALKEKVDELAGYKASYENGIRMEDGYGLN